MRKYFGGVLLVLLLIIGCSDSAYCQYPVGGKLEVHLKEYAKGVGPREMATCVIRQEQGQFTVYLTNIDRMSDYVNNPPGGYFELDGKPFLLYHGDESLLRPMPDQIIRKKAEQYLGKDLRPDGKDRRPDDVYLYDPPFWTITVKGEQIEVQKNETKKIPGWSYWRDRRQKN